MILTFPKHTKRAQNKINHRSSKHYDYFFKYIPKEEFSSNGNIKIIEITLKFSIKVLYTKIKKIQSYKINRTKQ